MYNRLLRFLNNHNIPSDNQYGFRKHHSTASAYALTCLYSRTSRKRPPIMSRICGRLREVVAYEKWSPTRGYIYSGLTRKLLVFWKSGR